MFHIVLVEPEIPPNTGNVIRLAANTACTLHLVEPMGFSMEDKHMRRAGLDYHEYTRVERHTNWESFLATVRPPAQRMFALSTRGTGSVFATRFLPGDYLVFGSETRGLSDQVRSHFSALQILKLPMVPGQRSLNLSNAVAVTTFEAWRQCGFAIPGVSVQTA